MTDIHLNVDAIKDADREYCVECGERIPEGAATSTE